MDRGALRDWPRDALMIVAAAAGEERVDLMTGHPERGRCRHCGRPVLYDSYTFARARQLEAEISRLRGKPAREVQFFCWACHLLYDVRQCGIIEDHRNMRVNP